MKRLALIGCLTIPAIDAYWQTSNIEASKHGGWSHSASITVNCINAAALDAGLRASDLAGLTEIPLEEDYTARLSLIEESKPLPIGAIWNEHSRRSNMPADREWLAEVKRYEREVLSTRG